MSKEKIHLEYLLNSGSVEVIWNMISKPSFQTGDGTDHIPNDLNRTGVQEVLQMNLLFRHNFLPLLCEQNKSNFSYIHNKSTFFIEKILGLFVGLKKYP